MIRLIDIFTGEEVYVGFKFGAFSIMAIDYVTKRILINHHGSLKEFNQQLRFIWNK